MLDLLAHAAPITYRFPLPFWLYAGAAAVAVLASAPAAAFGLEWSSVFRTSSRTFRVPHIGWIGVAVCTILLVIGFIGAFGAGGPEAKFFLENPMTVLTWVDFWVGLGLLAAFIGDVWEFISPVNALVRRVDAALARRETPVRPFPAAVGRWPAVALIVAWSWCELVWDQAKNPGVLGAMILVYFAASLVGTRIFGAAAWLDNVEVFTVMSRTFARFAPTALEPRSPDEFTETPHDQRRVRLRWFGAGVTSDPPLARGGGAFVIALLATVIFDGFSQTTRYVDLAQGAIRQWSWLGQHPDVLATIVMAAIVAAFVAAYLLVASVVGAAESSRDAAARYASTLVPIVAVYFAAHYFSYLLIAGQATLGVTVDPLTHGWNPGGLGEYELKKGWISGGSVWWTQVVLIVWGHIVAIMAAHRVALERGFNRVAALRLQLPLVLLMVGFTIAGLWVLAQQLKVVA